MFCLKRAALAFAFATVIAGIAKAGDSAEKRSFEHRNMARHEDEAHRALYEKDAKTRLEALNQEIKTLKGQVTTSNRPHEKTFRELVTNLDDQRVRIETMLDDLQEAPPEHWQTGSRKIDVAINDLQKDIKTVETGRYQ